MLNLFGSESEIKDLLPLIAQIPDEQIDALVLGSVAQYAREQNKDYIFLHLSPAGEVEALTINTATDGTTAMQADSEQERRDIVKAFFPSVAMIIESTNDDAGIQQVLDDIIKDAFNTNIGEYVMYSAKDKFFCMKGPATGGQWQYISIAKFVNLKNLIEKLMQ
jgi:hypothetical protein